MRQFIFAERNGIHIIDLHKTLRQLELAQKLFRDRQLSVPDAHIDRILGVVERSPRAIRQFVATADSRALAQGRAVNSGLIRELLEEMGAAGGMTDSPDSFSFVHEITPKSLHGEGEA